MKKDESGKRFKEKMSCKSGMKCKRGAILSAILTAVLLIVVLLTGCAKLLPGNGGSDSLPDGQEDIIFSAPGLYSYDSADTAVFVGRDNEAGTATFLNLEAGKRYTLFIDGTTGFYDKYGESISFQQVEIGDIVDLTFLSSRKHLTTLRLSSKAWSYRGVERYEINPVRGEISIGSDVYKLTSNTQYLSGGRKMDSMDLNASDILDLQGIGSQVLTVRVEKGHGYLRLTNDENFVGGWIEIGQVQIRRITEDMLLTLPEGKYQVSISHKGGGGTKSAVIRRNEETTLDIGDLEIPEPQHGMVLFSLEPAATELYIDGAKVDPSGAVNLTYGIHQLIARAQGYQSITRYIRVAQESVAINVVLDANDEKEDGEKASSSSASEISEYYKIYVDAPERVEVYLDGNYMGISPCGFKKSPGVHVITLRKNYCETRSYTVQIDDEEKDVSFSFADLVYTGSPTVSGNTSSP